MSSEPLLRALGLDRPAGTLYQRALRQHGTTVAELAAASDMTPHELRARLAPLVEAGLVELEDERVLVLSPAEGIGRLLSETVASAARANHRLEEIAGALPHLGSLTPRAPLISDREPIDAEIEYGGGVIAELRAGIDASEGDLLWLRPDQWLLSSEEEVAEIVAGAVAAGRRSRSLYPIRALTEAPTVMAHRVEIGEEIRVLPELPLRLAIIGDAYAMLADPLGYTAAPRTVVRQRSLVDAMRLLFEQLWDRAAPLAEGELAPGHEHQRRFLLEQLAAGAQDEQIARRLSVSLRTVRRRVAEVLAELGAESRFQAGVEATRRGWL